MNYQKELDYVIEHLDLYKNKLLLHSCCAPCSSYVLEYLSNYFDITVFYYNPNISEKEEYNRRVEEQIRLLRNMPCGKKISFLEGDFEPEIFFSAIKGLEKCKEGTERCFVCYEMRLEKTAILAKQMEFDYFATTLTISPLKNAEVLNEIGERLSHLYDIRFLPSDFKKRDGYKRSIELSKEYNLYRQDYCGCIYSKVQSQQQNKDRG
ncbi:MAG TPA: epoxyqueuosine reductase QueH [Lachnospiraceae bacterium]|nr:epoxyqueuosine reductase QueH [Lachnospiraceae bacterium]